MFIFPRNVQEMQIQTYFYHAFHDNLFFNTNLLKSRKNKTLNIEQNNCASNLEEFFFILECHLK